MMPLKEQLPLEITWPDDHTLETFYPGDNQQVVAYIKQMLIGKGEPFIYLWGRSGVGRTHLLQGACQFAHLHQLPAVYLPLKVIKKATVLENLERLKLVCIDDLEVMSGNPAWEEALFHLYNRLRAMNHCLLIAASSPARSLPLQLADLRSRLSSGITYQLQALNDEQLQCALQLRAKQKGLQLTDEVAAFMIRRCVRSMSDLSHQLEKLDKASLANQRRLTIPFIKAILAL